jgi:hypothetical protein
VESYNKRLFACNYMYLSQKITMAGVTSLLTAAVLLIASLAAIGLTQTNVADAASRNRIFHENFKGSSASADKEITEGGITTLVSVEAFTTTSGATEICAAILKWDDSSGDRTYLMEWFGCDPPDDLTISNSLKSATFSGTITDFDYATQQEKTVTVNADLTATGKAEHYTFREGFTSPNIKFAGHENGAHRLASGSIDTSGAFTFSTDDASGTISNVRAGSIEVERL